MTKPDIFKYFKMSPQIIRLAVMMYLRHPLLLRNVVFKGLISNGCELRPKV